MLKTGFRVEEYIDASVQDASTNFESGEYSCLTTPSIPRIANDKAAEPEALMKVSGSCRVVHIENRVPTEMVNPGSHTMPLASTVPDTSA